MKPWHRWLIGTLVVVALAAALALTTSGGQESVAASGQSRIYVDADATSENPDGSSWENAFTDLQDALADAEAGQQIWVAAGTYTPTWQFDSDPRSATFQMKNGVAIYGGFDPSVGDTEWEHRDWETNATILSGDIGEEGNPADNSYHVFYHPDGTNLDGTAILDGFTMSGGNSSVFLHRKGGGMFNDGSSPTLTNCTFSANRADYGGGMFNDGSSPTLTNCTFSGNLARQRGGGMYNVNSSPRLTNCTFSNNPADTAGGGMFNDGSSPALTNCTFWGNRAPGGAMAMHNLQSLPKLTNCILWGFTGGQIVGDTGTVTYSDIRGDTLYPGTGNINADPLFVDPDNGDFHLGPGSPCIDTGTNDAPYLPDYDFEGDDRILDGDGDGTATVDMGVDEALWHPVYLPLVIRDR